ncbi:hypothetical protein LZG04_11555 [Saccharothrix sp. S26]|uniref:hypothetical protein n=1 Tax=Saccharothrix sp. S26 TaxID=2907215 RepID=UPI001F1CD65C|nr:hypothetical protein [Saccharothrix sp. S26]MCE6995438.1 hypothetical protein [Saccharothrix sp. S26]
MRWKTVLNTTTTGRDARVPVVADPGAGWVRTFVLQVEQNVDSCLVSFGEARAGERGAMLDERLHEQAADLRER